MRWKTSETTGIVSHGSPIPALHVKPGTEWAAVLGRAGVVAPEGFGTDRVARRHLTR